MAEKFDHGRPKVYFGSKFLTNHVFVGGEGAKKRAEKVFQRRGKSISTVLCLTPRELVELAGEIHRRQDEFNKSPNRTYTTERAYDCWSRGGPKSKDDQRATQDTKCFKYNVKRVGEIYVLFHFDG
jgi:hypothetical protein